MKTIRARITYIICMLPDGHLFIIKNSIHALTLFMTHTHGTTIIPVSYTHLWEQPILKAKEGNIYKLPDCITEGYPMVFTLSEDGQTLVNWDLQATGYKHATYGMVYFTPTDMQRQGNKLLFAMRGAVAVEGGYGILYSGFTETLELPE